MIKLAAAALVLAALSGGEAQAAAPPKVQQVKGGVADPVRFIKAALGFDKISPDQPSSYEMLDQDKPEYTPRLRELFRLQQIEQGKDEVGRLDMSIWTGTQDDDIKSVDVTSADVEYAKPPRRIVTARFDNMNHKQVMHFYFEKKGDRWFLDDVETPGENKPDGFAAWTLSIILKYGWGDY